MSAASIGSIFAWAMTLVCALACTQQRPAPILPQAKPRPQTAPTAPLIPLPPPPTSDVLPLDDLHWPAVHEQELPSGVQVRAVRTPGLPLCQLRVVIPTGRRDDGDKAGLAQMTALSMLEGAVGADAPTQRLHGLERLADVFVRVDAGATLFGLSFTAADADEVIEHVRTMLITPGFRRSAVEQARRLVPRLGASEPLFNAVQVELGGVPVVDEKTLPRIKGWHCRAFHKARYALHGATVVWVGDIAPDRARVFTERLFDGWKPVPSQPLAASEPVSGGQEDAEPPEGGRVQAALIAKGPEPGHEDWPALWLVAQSMTKSCPALPWAMPAATFRICDTLDAAGVEAWKRETQARLARLGKNGLGAPALEIAKHRLIQEESARLRDPAALADTLARWAPAHVDAVGERIRDVQDVAGAVRRNLSEAQVHFVVAAP